MRRPLRRAGPRERQPAAGEDRESQGLPDAHDHARGAGAHLRSARPRSHGAGGRQTLDGRTGRTPLPATGARRTAGTQGRRHDRRVQHRLRRRTRPHGRPSQSGCRPRLHRHRRGRHHGRRGRNGASGRGRTAPRGGLRGQKLSELRFHDRAVALQGARDGRLRRRDQEHLDRHRLVGGQGVDPVGRQDEKRRRDVERPAPAGRLPGIDGRSGQGRRRPLRRADPLHQRDEQPLGRLRLRRPPCGTRNGRHRHPRLDRPRGAGQGLRRPGLRIGRSRQSPPDRAHRVAPRPPPARPRGRDRTGQPRLRTDRHR